jgi:hypothetical protein
MRPACGVLNVQMFSGRPYADACSLGLDGEQYCLPIVDKGTEHLVNFNRKLRYDPV